MKPKHNIPSCENSSSCSELLLFSPLFEFFTNSCFFIDFNWFDGVIGGGTGGSGGGNDIAIKSDRLVDCAKESDWKNR